jgi:hypothetical protein
MDLYWHFSGELAFGFSDKNNSSEGKDHFAQLL